MSALADVAKRIFRGQENDVAKRLDGLATALEASDGRIDEEITAPAQMLTERATERLRLSGEHTIVALAGATGSGKSSLFNQLTDLELAGVGVRRPTTSWALACSWGPDGAGELLEWMGIPPRHQVSRMSMLDKSSEDTKLDGLVLLDLPDHDSTEVAHHLEMDRLVTYADLLVWVLDPQKYADAAIHDRYIRPMAGYADVTLVVLNQIDKIPYEARERAMDDVRRILAEEGLPGVPVIAVSSTRGDGIDDLKRELAQRIRAKASAKTRLGSDIGAAADVIAQVGGTAKVPGIGDADRAALDQALVECAGVPEVTEAVAASTRRRAVRSTGWPPTRWLGRLRKDPLSKLGLGDDLHAIARSAAPSTSVQRASAQNAVRALTEKAAVGLEQPWRDAIRSATSEGGADVVARLDDAVSSTDLGVARPALWWRLVNVLQWLAFLTLLAGIGWAAAVALSGLSDLEIPDPPVVKGFSLPLLLIAGGAVAGIVLAVLSRFAANISGRRKAAKADRALRAAIDEVAQEHVIAPVQAELDRYERYREGIITALN